MAETQSLAAKMRERLNKRAGKELAQVITKTEDLLQVESWIPMPEWFNRATGGKGLPVGHITIIIGKTDSGKTTDVMIAMVNTQQAGGIVYLIDNEHKFSFDRFRLMGGIPEDVIVIPCDSLEDSWNAWDIINEDVADLRKTDQETFVLAAWDSVAASVPDAILDSEAEDKHVSVDAKINNVEVRKLRKRIRTNKIAAFFITHSYYTMPKFGVSEEIIKGGAELAYMATLILKTKRRAWLKRTVNGIDERFGVHALLEVFKGHLGGSKATTPYYIVGQGVMNNEKELANYKNLIEGIDGPDINLLTLTQLEEIHASKPKKEKKSDTLVKVKSKKSVVKEVEESEDGEEA